MRFIHDLLSSSTAMRGTPTGITYVSALHRNVAYFDANTDRITYLTTYWPKEGTVGFWCRALTAGSILASSTSAGMAAGDIYFERTAGGFPSFKVHDGSIHTLTGANALATATYYWIVLSWGSAGMKMWIDGVVAGAFTGGDSIGARSTSHNVCLGDYGGGGGGFTGYLSDIRVSDVQSDPTIIYGDDAAMALRIHSYGVNAQYGMDFQYKRNDLWSSLKSRVRSADPVAVTKEHGQFFSASLSLDNDDGLLSLNNRTSLYNLNAGVYDPLLDEARRVRILQGIECYPNASSGITPTASPAPGTGSLAFLTDRLYGSPETSTDTNWVKWSLGANAAIALKIDLGASKTVRCGALSFMSNGTIKLPATVLFEYSVDDIVYTPCCSAFSMSEYSDSIPGQQYLAWFTDMDKSARYIKATITNGAAANTVAIDEFVVYAGETASLIAKETINGYLGDQIDSDNSAATIALNFMDVRKRESDQRRVELTKKYKNQRPEEIIYDLLTSTNYWTGIVGAYDAPLLPADIGWAETDNLSDFVIPSWQGQSGTIQDYIDQLAKVIGWVYDCDGDGKRQFWEPEYYRETCSTHMSFFGQRWGMRGTPKRHRTGADIRNCIWVAGKQAKIGTNVGYNARDEGSIARYGVRYARITEPLAKTAELQERLGRALIRDFAYCKDGLTLDAKGDFDIERPKVVCTFNEPIREHLDLGELWSLESLNTQMTTAGRGQYRATMVSRYYKSAPPRAISNLTAVAVGTAINLSWDANTDANLDGYYVYMSNWNPDPTNWSFTKRSKVTSPADSITGLVDGASYVYYVRAVNRDGVEGPSCIPLIGGTSGSEPVNLSVETQWKVSLDWAGPSESGTNDVILSYTTTHLLWPLLPDSAIVAIYGPSIEAVPPDPSEQLTLIAAAMDGTETLYRRHAKTSFASGATVRVLPKLYRLTINGIQYELGAAITGNGYACTWPTYS